MSRTKLTVLFSTIATLLVILLGVPLIGDMLSKSGVPICQLPKANAQDNPCLAQEATISAMQSALLQATLDRINSSATIAALQTQVGGTGQDAVTATTPARASGLTAVRPASVAQLDAAQSVWQFVGFRDLDNPGARTYDAKIPASMNKLRLEFMQCVPTQAGFKKLDELMTFAFGMDGTPIDDSQVLVYDYKQEGPYPYCRRWGTLITGMKPGLTTMLDIHYTWSDTLFLKSFVIPAGDYSHSITVTFR